VRGKKRKKRENAYSPRRDASRHKLPQWMDKCSLLFMLLIVFCSFIAYWNALGNGFAYDDYVIILENPVIRSLSSLPSSLGFYRPMRWFSFALDYHFWKLNPVGYHLTNVLLHAGCALLVFHIVNLLIKDRVGSLMVSLIFCTYPVATEAVDNISNRNELLGTLFSLSAFFLYIQKSKSLAILLAVVPLHFLGLLSKEGIGIALPLLYIVYDLYYTRDRDGKLSVSQLAPGFAFLLMSVLAITYVIVAWDAGHVVMEAFRMLRSNTFVDANPFLISMNLWVRAMAKGILLVFYPRKLSADYPVPRISSMVDGDFVFSMAVISLFAILVVLVSKRSRAATLGLLWLPIFLLPSSNIIPITMHYMADRYLYAPSIGYCLFAGVALSALYRWRIAVTKVRVQKGAALALLMIWLALSIRADWRRNRDWESDYTIWAKTAVQQPESPVAHLNFGYRLQQRGRIDDAMMHYRRAIAIIEGYNPSETTRDLGSAAHNNMASAYTILGMHKEAITELRTSIALDSLSGSAFHHLGVAYFNEGDMDSAITNFRKAIRFNYNDSEAHFALSYAYGKKGLTAEARVESAIGLALRKKSGAE